MGFLKKVWTNRQSQYPNRRKLSETNVDKVYEIERAEGEVLEPGNQFNAENMNDLEDRINKCFTGLTGADITIKDEKNYFTATKLNGVLNELFTFADDGKKALVSAIGATRKGMPTLSETFTSLSSRVKNDKVSYYYKGIFRQETSERTSFTRSEKVTIKFPVETMHLECNCYVVFRAPASPYDSYIWFDCSGILRAGSDGDTFRFYNALPKGGLGVTAHMEPLPSYNNPTSIQIKFEIEHHLSDDLSAYKFDYCDVRMGDFYAWGKMT